MKKKALILALVLTSVTMIGCWNPFRRSSGVNSARESSYNYVEETRNIGAGGQAPRSVRTREGANLFRLPMIDGRPVMVKAPAVLFFFTSWCSYCKTVFPEFKRVTEVARSQGWRVYGIDVGEGPEKVNQVIQQHQPNFPVLLDQQSLVAKNYNLEGYPTFIVVDENSNIMYNSHEVPGGF